jgi:hypothetical protein
MLLSITNRCLFACLLFKKRIYLRVQLISGSLLRLNCQYYLCNCGAGSTTPLYKSCQKILSVNLPRSVSSFPQNTAILLSLRNSPTHSMAKIFLWVAFDIILYFTMRTDISELERQVTLEGQSSISLILFFPICRF